MSDPVQIFRERGVPGTIGFSIVAKDTERNRSIHGGFKEFSELECKGDYTLALAKLLEYYTGDARTELLWHAIQAMETRIADLELKLEEADKKKTDDGGLF